MDALLTIEHLSVSFLRDGVEVTPVPDVSLHVGFGERVALVGESGCGKSMTALGVTRLAPTDRATITGSIRFNHHALANQPDAISQVRRGGIAYVFQDPSGSLNPVMRVGRQVAEALPDDLPRHARQSRVVELLADTGLPRPEELAQAYPCELSGGQQQRVMLAMALASEPELLIADEPTTALDVTTQRQVLALMDRLAKDKQMAVLFITHNLGIVAEYMQRVYVMYAGRIVEEGAVVDVLKSPHHPYTQGLLKAIPSLAGGSTLEDIPGTVPPPGQFPAGCTFAPRCSFAQEACRAAVPPLRAFEGRQVRCILGGAQ